MPAKAFMMRMATADHRPSQNYTNHKPYLLSIFSLILLITSSVMQVAMMARETMPIICIRVSISQPHSTHFSEDKKRAGCGGGGGGSPSVS
jgi:hypothetical protein